jgi:AraC family transcriptional regulator of adaptative response/methylated-DNA-[protein]-cysteine methyltransferase
MTSETLRYAVGDTDLGLVLAAGSTAGLRLAILGDDRQVMIADLARRFPAAALIEDPAALAPALSSLAALIAEPGRAADLPLDVVGTPLQQKVWAALRAIPAGATASYGQVAVAFGRPRAARAVAQACAANPLAVITPCHRVVRADGGLSGYRWGVERKRALLARESKGEVRL